MLLSADFVLIAVAKVPKSVAPFPQPVEPALLRAGIPRGRRLSSIKTPPALLLPNRPLWVNRVRRLTLSARRADVSLGRDLRIVHLPQNTTKCGEAGAEQAPGNARYAASHDHCREVAGLSAVPLHCAAIFTAALLPTPITEIVS